MSDKKKTTTKKKVAISQKKLQNIKMISDIKGQLSDESEVFVFVIEPDGNMQYNLSSGDYNMLKSMYQEIDIMLRRKEYKFFRKEELQANAKNVMAQTKERKSKQDINKKLEIVKN